MLTRGEFYIIFFISLINTNVLAENNRIIIASTTSAYDSGLLEYVNNEFEMKFDIKVHVLALGTGQAIKIAKNGDADILLVHDTLSEIDFIKEGYGNERYNLMYNDYVIVGPKTDNDKCDSIANILLNNPLNCACLETTFLGPKLCLLYTSPSPRARG